MAIGERFPVVMGFEKAVTNGVATLDENGILVEEQRPKADSIFLPDGITPVSTALNNSVPTSRTINKKALSEDISLDISDVGGSNPNLLDNWYFVDPISQRGQTEYTADYAIDRWETYSGKVTLNENSITFQTDGSPLSQFMENLELKSIDSSKVYTLSFLVGNQLITATNKFPTAQDVHRHYVEIGEDTWALGLGNLITKYMVTIRNEDSTKKSIELVAAKLELGNRQTLAHQDASGNWVLNDPPPNKALELTKCQRYQIFSGNNRMLGTKIASIASNSPGSVSLFFPSPVTMRSNPSIVGNLMYNTDNTPGNYKTIPTRNIYTINAMSNGIYVYVQGAEIDFSNVTTFFLDANSGFDANL